MPTTNPETNEELKKEILESLYIEYDNDGEGHIKGGDVIVSTLSDYLSKYRSEVFSRIKKAGYGYDDGSGFVLKISFKDLAELQKEETHEYNYRV